MISNDGNAEKLSSIYEPHVCLNREALVRLLDNHGPDFGEQWELPVVVKVNAGKGWYVMVVNIVIKLNLVGNKLLKAIYL